jgi:hypothetical protein
VIKAFVASDSFGEGTIPKDAECDGRECRSEHHTRHMSNCSWEIATDQNDDSQGTICDAAVIKPAAAPIKVRLALVAFTNAPTGVCVDASNRGNRHDNADAGGVPLALGQKVNGQIGTECVSHIC